MTQQNNTPATIASIQQFSFFNAEQFATMQRVATMFCNSELVPDMYRVTADNPKEKAIANCIIAIDIANRNWCQYPDGNAESCYHLRSSFMEFKVSDRYSKYLWPI